MAANTRVCWETSFGPASDQFHLVSRDSEGCQRDSVAAGRVIGLTDLNSNTSLFRGAREEAIAVRGGVEMSNPRIGGPKAVGE
jgi:hypothetical protein